MKKLFYNLLFSVLILASAFSVSAEEIDSFTADIKINGDGTINVKESITYDFGSLYRHGIFREIPFIKVNVVGKKYRMEFSDFAVKDEGGIPYQYKVTREGDEISIKIGDPDRTITGVKRYIIDYKVSGALTYFSDHDELYWNSTGNGWDIPINSARTTITLPEAVGEDKLKMTCYTGPVGSTNQSCTYLIKDGLVVFDTENPLLYNEGISVVLGFPKGTVAVLEPKVYVPFWETPFGRILGFILMVVLVVAAIAWYIIAPFYIIYKWFKEGRDPKGTVGQTTAWFDPPKSIKTSRALTPAEVGTLGDETVDLKDISAAIIDLARRGFLKIEERAKKDFYLLRTTPQTKAEHALLPFEQVLLDKFFKGGKQELRLKTAKLYDEVEAVKTELYEGVVTEGLFPKNPQSIRTVYYVISFLALFTGNIFLAFVAFVFGRAMPRKTVDGVNAKNISFSLKNFLSSQERQLKFQADKQLMFEKLLPYAVAFGVEKIWAKRFENLNLKQPDWYSGYENGHFNSYIFVSSMNSSLNSFSKAATPSRSSTGHSSGFSGGFSGGGGGGGGGGSW
jgi:uncharacterized membrane protein